MKKILLLLTMVLAIGLTSYADGTYSRNVSILPEEAKVVLAKNFQAEVSLIKTDKTLGFVSEYEVILNDGSEITFNKNGIWQTIEMPAGKVVPQIFVLKGISSYIEKNFPNQKIVGVSKQSKGFEVELSNSIEMNFDKNGNFIGYDK